MNYIYNDEDNAAMNDDPFSGPHNPTVYSSYEEMRAIESGEYFAHLKERMEAERQKQKDHLDGLLDMLGLKGKCRECPWITELGDGFLDKNGLISNEQIEYLESACRLCGGKGTGIIPEKVQGWLDNEWGDRLEWAKNTLPRISCAWCPMAFRIYGQYKDPDDEWDAIDSKDGCANCKYFQEAE